MKMMEILQDDKALVPVFVDVQDISGGCGASYQVVVVSDKFEGLTLIKRNRYTLLASCWCAVFVHALTQGFTVTIVVVCSCARVLINRSINQ
jgi:stress-induced morphogen